MKWLVELCQRLAGLKESREYRESVQNHHDEIQAKDNQIMAKTKQLREKDKLIQQKVDENESLIRQLHEKDSALLEETINFNDITGYIKNRQHHERHSFKKR